MILDDIRARDDFFTIEVTLMALAAVCGSGKLSKDLEKLLISAHRHVEHTATLLALLDEIGALPDKWRHTDWDATESIPIEYHDGRQCADELDKLRKKTFIQENNG